MPGQTKYYNVEASTIKRDITTMTIITVNVIQFAILLRCKMPFSLAEVNHTFNLNFNKYLGTLIKKRS